MRMLVSRAIMQFVPRRQTFTGEEVHPFDPSQESSQGGGPFRAIGVIVERLDDQPHTLSLTQHQFILGLENTVCVDSLCKLSHSIKPSVIRLARAARRIKFPQFPVIRSTERSAAAFREAYAGRESPNRPRSGT